MALLSSLFGGNKAAAMPAAQPMSPEAQYLQNMQRLSQGDVSSVLTGGDKLLALSALLGSVARGSRTTPQEVMAQVQQQAQGRIGSQMQLAQLQAKAEQDRRNKEFLKTYSQALPEDKRGVLENLPADEALKLVSQEAFRPKQVFQTKRDPDTGNMRIIFGDGSSQVTDIKLPANTEDRDIGGAIQVVDKDSGKVIETVTKTMTPYQVANYGLAQQRAARAAAAPRGGGGGGSLPEPKMVTINGKPVMAQWDKRTQQYVPFTRQAVSRANSNPMQDAFERLLPGGTGTPLYGGR